jgi:pilus assembly protein FimV
LPCQGAAQALGLGEIHLDSALNEPLAADIDIVGATAEDLAGITASIANRETFQQFGVDRPAFLSTVAFKISRDSRGRAVLAIRSTDACTEPLLNMLVDLTLARRRIDSSIHAAARPAWIPLGHPCR